MLRAITALAILGGTSGLVPTAPGSAKESLLSIFKGAPDPVLACPISREPLVVASRFLGGARNRALSSASGASYSSNALFADLVAASPASASPPQARSRAERVQTDTFRSPFVAFLYERGWRQNFDNSGFPGIDAEFIEVNDFFQPARSGVVVDLSCGTGLMSRRLARSGQYSRVIAADYSEAMLAETARRFDNEGLGATERPELVRCDSAQLPFQSGSVAALHAGAALHCWPRLEEALVEVHRVLRPGGVFYASTFTNAALLASSSNPSGLGFRLFEIDELEGLMADAGFSGEGGGAVVRLEGRGCAIVKCTKA